MNYKDDRFELDSERRELRVGGRVVAVQPKVYALLSYLVQRPGTAVSKDELLEAIWPNAFVSETALTRCVMKARLAIGDNKASSRAIQTLHGHGYRFIRSEGGAATPQSPQDTAPAPWTLGRRGLVALMVLTFTAVATVLFLVSRQGDPRPVDRALSSVPKIAVLPIDNTTGREDLEWTEIGLLSLVHEELAQRPGISSVRPESILAIANQSVERPGEDLTVADETLQLIDQLEDTRTVIRSRLVAVEDGLALDYVIYHDGGVSLSGQVQGQEPTQLGRALARELSARFLRPDAGAVNVQPISEDPQALEAYAKGLSVRSAGKYDEAIAEFERGLLADPGNFWLQHEIAQILTRQGQYAAATERLDLLLEEGRLSDRKSATLYLGYGDVEFRSGNFLDGRKYFEMALDHAEKAGASDLIVQALIELGSVSTDMREFDTARTYLNRALEVSTAQPEGSLPELLMPSMGILEASEGRFEEAIPYFEAHMTRDRLLGDMSSMPYNLGNLGRLSHELGRYSDAERYYTESVALFREQQALGALGFDLVRLGALQADWGKEDDALRSLSESVEIARTTESNRVMRLALKNRGDLFEDMGRTEDALADMSAWLELEREFGTETTIRGAELGVAALQIRTGQAEAALDLAQSVIDTPSEPADPFLELDAWLVKAEALHALERSAQTAEARSTALELIRQNDSALSQVGAACRLARLEAPAGEVTAFAMSMSERHPDHHCLEDLDRSPARP
ncbi:MAG: tetratricopeptide repeat protein [Litorimonas sp.]